MKTDVRPTEQAMRAAKAITAHWYVEKPASETAGESVDETEIALLIDREANLPELIKLCEDLVAADDAPVGHRIRGFERLVETAKNLLQKGRTNE